MDAENEDVTPASPEPSEHDEERQMVRLRLYIAGHSGPSQAALSTVERLQDSATTAVEVEIVDVLEHPDRAEQARVLATPTLDRVEPWPTRRIIGDLGDLRSITETFGLELGGGAVSVPEEGTEVSVSSGARASGGVDLAVQPTVAFDPSES